MPIQIGKSPLIKTCSHCCLIILLLPLVVVVANYARADSGGGGAGAGVPISNRLGHPILANLPSDSRSPLSKQNPIIKTRLAHHEHRRRYEYSKPGKHFRWDTRRWVKDYGSISKRIRRSPKDHRMWVRPAPMPSGQKKLMKFKNNYKYRPNHPKVQHPPSYNLGNYHDTSNHHDKLREKAHRHSPARQPPPNNHSIRRPWPALPTRQPARRLNKPKQPTTKQPREQQLSPKELQQAAVGSQKVQADLKKPSSRNQLESVLDIPGIKCGKVPLYEKLYHRSINESYEIDPETGDFRILHGLDSVVGEWPWIVRITECLDDESCATCTGTLLNDRWVITAGHCAFNQTTHPERYKASFGLYDLVSPENTSFTVPIGKMIVHPDYKDLDNDLTLIRLAKPVQFNDMIQPACLVRPTRNIIDYAKGKRCYAVGYGLIDGMEDAIKLQKLEIRAKQPSECNSYELGAVQLKPGTVCIGPPPGKTGSSCKGDSGGPNLCYDPKLESWQIISTVSYGPPNCDRENGDSWLTVSVDLSNYRTWILSTILANS